MFTSVARGAQSWRERAGRLAVCLSQPTPLCSAGGELILRRNDAEDRRADNPLAACKTLANPSASKPEDTTPESSKGGYGTHLRRPTPLASTLASPVPESAVKTVAQGPPPPNPVCRVSCTVSADRVRTASEPGSPTRGCPDKSIGICPSPGQGARPGSKDHEQCRS